MAKKRASGNNPVVVGFEVAAKFLDEKGNEKVKVISPRTYHSKAAARAFADIAAKDLMPRPYIEVYVRDVVGFD